MPHVHNWMTAFRRILFLFFGGWMSFFSPLGLRAQVVDGVYISPGRGFVVPHRPELRGLVSSHSTTFFAGFWKDTRYASKPKHWHGLYGYPQWGIEAYYSDLGNRRALGHQFAAITFIKVPSKRLSGERIAASAIWGIGAGYNTRVWDLGENPKGIALGSHFNVCLAAGYLIDVKLRERLHLETGVRFTHFSNGAIRLPNLGTNNLSAQVGLRYGFRRAMAASELAETPPPSIPKNNEYRVHATVGMKQNLPPGGPNFMVYNLAGEYTRRLGYKHGLLLRADGWFNTASAALLQGETESLDRIQAGLAVGYRRHFGAATFDIQMGAYVFTRYQGNGAFYHRFQLAHRLSEDWSASLGLTTHWARAHHPEIGLYHRF